MTAPTFQVGQSYSGRFIGDADAVFQVMVLARTAKTVTVTVTAPGAQGTTKHRITHDHEGGEQIFPFGKFGMAPVCRAKRLVVA